ncbi:MAG TPA: hypothetical protein VLJ19_22195 [Variovorax sp.]|nr:hypothetical protein [Variovorax sp.]
MEALSERTTFAAVLVTVVRQRCAETGSSRTSRTGLQLRVPVDERPSVRRGFDALIEHGVLGMSGEDIGLTAHGLAFMAYYRRQRGDIHGVEDLRDPDALNHLLASIEGDPRFDPDRDIEEASTLPGRLEEPRDTRRGRLPKLWIVLALIVTLIGVVLLALPAR